MIKNVKTNIRNFIVNGGAFDDLQRMNISFEYIHIVQYISRFKHGITFSSINKTFGKKSLLKKLNVLCKKGYLIQKKINNTSMYCISSDLKCNNQVRLQNCCRCADESELFDELTSNYFCGACYQRALEHSKKFSSWKHFKQRLLERYEINLNVDIYKEIIRQIKSKKLSTLDDNSHKNLRKSDHNKSRHLVFIEEKIILVIFEEVQSPLGDCLLTALPVESFKTVSINSSNLKNHIIKMF